MITNFFKAIPVFAAAAAVGFVTTTPGEADAYEVVSAASCWNETDYAEDYLFTEGLANNSNGWGARARRVVCPMTNSTSQPRTSVGSLYVSGYDGNNENNTDARIRAQVCLKSFSSSASAVPAATCSWAEELTSGTYTGEYDGSLGTTARSLWQDAGKTYWYASLMVYLPKQGVKGRSQVYGFSAF